MTIKLQKLLSIILFACGAGAISLAAPAHAEYCNNEGKQAWCGGGSTAGNALDQMSCTPFAYKPWSFNNANGLGGYKNSFCTSDTVKDVAGGPYQSQAWMYNKGDGTKDTSYWVFHGCDGAGIMPDCLGDVLFLERFYGYAKDQSKVWCQGGITVNQVASHTTDKNSNRRQCKFKHPGTGHIYENYEAGIWQWGKQFDIDKFRSAATGKWSQRAENAVRSVQNPFPNAENKNVLYMMTFPWVCTGIGRGGATEGEGDATNGLFTQTNTPGVKCYWDNESGASSNTPDSERGPYWPPQMNLYWMNLRTDNGNKYLDVRGYTLDNNSMTMKSLGQWTLEPYGSPW
ncbi:hypothetical protein [Synechococcus sp. MVIR-18-1]|uniref:hypothetical protein n=1 Tax=Synechococcus sp. MVIR-18-1 TaxID=1386941 RepID=UPI0016467FF0|nr:hypothetical protein [Synechococcus sp. MVIR-18-1]QNI77561.1 hypothetical protein SynMVIR181_02613 [Synechococcus sp. MVIR-18-1]